MPACARPGVYVPRQTHDCDAAVLVRRHLAGFLERLEESGLRTVQAFRCRPGERITWSFGQVHGEAIAGADGSVTIPDLPLTDAWTTLVLRRVPPGLASPG